MGTPIVIAKNINDTSKEIVLLSQFANRHGLIAGATGTGKTVTLQTLAENFSRIGVPVFMADTTINERPSAEELADIAMHEGEAFTALIAQVKAALPQAA